MGWFIGIGLGL